MSSKPKRKTDDENRKLWKAYLQTRDRKLFRRLHRELAPRLFGFFRDKELDAPTCKDLVSDTFEALLSSRTFVAGKIENYDAYIFKMAWNVFNTHYKKQKARRHKMLEAISGLPPPNDMLQEEAFGSEQQLQRVMSKLGELKPKQEQIIRLFYLRGFDFSEIALELNITDNNARVLKHRALEKLRLTLDLKKRLNT